MEIRLTRDDARLIAEELHKLQQGDSTQWLTVAEYVAELAKQGINKSEKTVSRWCRELKFSKEDFKHERGQYWIKKGAKIK